MFFHVLFEENFDESVYKKLIDLLDLNTSLNDELSSNWYQIALKNGIKDVIPFVQKFLAKVGRIRYLRPIYKALFLLDKEKALNFFAENK